MAPQSTKTLYRCRHAELTKTETERTNQTGKKTWRMLRRKKVFSCSSTETSPFPCPACVADQEREIRMRRFLDNLDRPSTANPLRERRAAPPTRGVNETLMAVALGEAPNTISALKSIQQKSKDIASNAEAIPNPTEQEQEAQLERARDDMEKADRLWWEVHQSHREQIRFPPFDVPYSMMAGPQNCRLCQGYLQVLTNSQYRQRTGYKDHFVPEDEAFSPDIRDEFEDFGEPPT